MTEVASLRSATRNEKETMMRRVAVGIVGLFSATAVLTRLAEAMGLGRRYRCACESPCWCKQPGLSLFRWVTPARWHDLPKHPLSAEDKQRLAENL
jgi:hypothetical protein